jgi:hypothetical protein
MRDIRFPIFLAAGVCAAMTAGAQEVMNGPGPARRPILVNSDMAVLEAGEARKDLNCTVTPEKPVLGLDLKFHAGYTMTIPVKELEGAGQRLVILFRVAPPKGEAVYFNQYVRVPPITEGPGEVMLNGSFDVGEGEYHVDWLARDTGGRYCSFNWDAEAALAPRDKQVTPAVAAGWIGETEDEKFQAEPPPEHKAEAAPLSVKVLMNFAPERPESAEVSPQDRLGLISILRNLMRNPRIGKISLVTFNLDQQRVLYRQDFENQIDFPALGRALKSLKLGTIDASQLGNRKGGAEFLLTVARNEMANRDLEGLIFVGPKSLIFYMNYIPDPAAAPWRDAIGKMVKFFRGREFTISGPRDLWNAVSEAVDRMSKFQQTRSAAVSGGN